VQEEVFSSGDVISGSASLLVQVRAGTGSSNGAMAGLSRRAEWQRSVEMETYC
jgi:hypothetical protein